MNSASILICDDEQNYALHLMEYLKTKEMPYEIGVFFSSDRLLKCASPETTAVLIVSESEYTAEIYNAGFRSVLVLNETDAWLGDDLQNVSKYQSMEVIYDEVMRLCWEQASEEGAVLPNAIRHGRRMRLIGIYSPVKRTLQTQTSLCLGQLLAKKYRTLYMNFENYSGLTRLLDRSFRGNVSDLLYFNECAKGKFASQLGMMTVNVGGLSILPPMHSFMELQSIRKEQWLDLFDTIEKVSDYEYLILDLSESTDGLLGILRECSEVITLILPGSRISEAKMQEYRSILQERGYEDVYAKTHRWQMPVFRELPANLSELTHSELADRIRKLMGDIEHDH